MFGENMVQGYRIHHNTRITLRVDRSTVKVRTDVITFMIEDMRPKSVPKESDWYVKCW